MISVEYKKKAMEALQNISAKELVSILLEIGSVQIDARKHVCCYTYRH